MCFLESLQTPTKETVEKLIEEHRQEIEELKQENLANVEQIMVSHTTIVDNQFLQQNEIESTV